MAIQISKLHDRTARNRVAQAPQQRTQAFIHSKQDSELPIGNFEQWAQLVKSQMLASLQCRYKHSPD